MEGMERNMNDDLISRQALMKEFSDYVRASNNSDFAGTPTWNDAVSLVGSMPPAQPELIEKAAYIRGFEQGRTQGMIDTKAEEVAQPEIIRCKECRWWDKYGDFDIGYCMAAKHGHFSKHWEISIRRTYKGDFYCADAEPKGEQNG